MLGHVPLVDPFSPIARQEPTANTGNSWTEKTHENKGNENDEQRRKAARRKSLANRRVSFAPEATLHTWSVMELLEDSTTSSASNSTRRQSSMTAAQSPLVQTSSPQQDHPDRPTTPVEQHNDEVVHGTPESQRTLHQRKRRRSSDTMQSSDDDEAMSSPGDGGDSSPIRVEDSIDSESDTDGDTAMSLDEATSHTVRSTDSSSTQTSLDERLRQAATQAGTRGIENDENLSADEDDQTMELVNSTVTHAFKKYSQPHYPTLPDQQSDSEESIEHSPNGRPVPADYEDESNQDEATMGMTMDMTRAVGGIVSNTSSNRTKSFSNRRKSNVSRRVSSGDDTSYGDETMDLTVAKGGILTNGNEELEDDNDDDNDGDDQEMSDEDMTMEMTNVVGGLRGSGKRGSTRSLSMEDTESMDMTMAAGGILHPIEEQTEPQTDLDEEMTGAMDMTRAVGKIIPRQHNAETAEQAPAQDVESVTQPMLNDQLDHEPNQPTAGVQSMNRHMATIASDTGSPTLKPRLSARKSASNSRSSTPRSAQKPLSPEVNGQTTPSKQLTPLPARGSSPQRTPLLPVNIMHRGASPKKLFVKELREKSSPASRKSPRRQQDALFSKDESTGLHTPRVVLQAPKPHHSSRKKNNTTVIDDDSRDHGSPRVSEILSRRSSIGDAAPEFQLQQGRKRSLRFEDPQEMAQEIEAERVEEQRRESGRFIMEQETNEQHDENTTQNLRDMIESMTPKKENPAKFKSRKSLAVGSGKGLLGKRPAELDIDEDDDVDGESTPKRLKAMSREGSPVKKVHLPKPPTKEQTTGRLTKAEKLGLAAATQSASTPTLSLSPSKEVGSPEHTGHFRNPASHPKPQSFESRLDNVVGATDVSTTHPDTVNDLEEEKISLQQFLTMTNVHFIELSTTKRRHTIAQPQGDTDVGSNTDDTSKAVFTAAATTLPLLELYQHATKELKSYISSGRKIIRAIEAETLADQPAIFKKYVDARPEHKAIMDNQFRNAKTNARLQSKEGWYSWRSQLVDGLRSGLEGVKADLEKDEQILSTQQSSLSGALSTYKGKKQILEQELLNMRRRLLELDSIDREALQARRDELASTDQDVNEKTSTFAKLQSEMKEKEEVLSQAAELRQEMSDQINEALRVQEEQRRWHSKDVAASKLRVEKLEQESGWKLLTAEEDSDEPNDLGVALTLRYKNQLRLFFYPSAFESKSNVPRRRSGRKSRSVSGPVAPISLTYSPDEEDESQPKELPSELRFFLQLIQGQLQSFTMMPKGTITCQTLLKTVAHGWSLAQNAAQEICQLNSAGIVNVSIQGDEKLSSRLMLIQPDRSRVDIEFTLSVLVLNNGELSVSTNLTASPLYGPVTSLMDASKTRKVQHALSKEVESKKLGGGSWISAIRGFEEWLHAQALSQAKQDVPKADVAPAQPSTLPQPEIPRATTQSPQRVDRQNINTNTNGALVSTTPKVPPRSPLAPRTTNSKVIKKALPVPKKPVNFSASQSRSQLTEQNSFSMSVIGREAMQQKENIGPLGIPKWNGNGDGMNGKMMANLDDDVFAGSQPAIPPEMQEAMMHTPNRKRIGALRRSPI